MRIFCLAIILFILCSSFTIAQNIDEPIVSATITLHSDTELETVRELSPGTNLTFLGNNTYSVRLRLQDIDLLRWLGIDVSVSGTSKSQRIQKPRSLPNSTAAPNTFIQEMVNTVAKESLRATIQRLQDFGTRYEYAPTQDSAGAYLYKEFQRWGFDVAYDSFALGTSTVYDLDYVTPNVGWACGTSGLIAYTTDGGSGWINHSSGFTNNFYGVDFISPTTGWVVSDGGVILQSTNGGVTWTSQTSPVTNTLYDVNFVNDQRGLIVGVSGRILRTTNGGGTWTSIASGTTNTLRKVSFVDSLHAWAVGGVAGSSGIVLRSTDGGLTWLSQSIPSPSNYLRGVCFIDSLHGWAAGDGPTILKTMDGGTNWIAKTPPTGTGTILRGVSFINLLEGWIGDYYGKLLHTTDGGESWSVSYTLPGGLYLVDLCALDSQRITLAGTSSAIIASTDGGLTWLSQSSNLPSQFFHHTQNVVATLPGLVTPDQECVIVAHYDSYSNNPYVSAPGANDNATGTSAVMEAARICRGYQFRSTIKFLAVSAEELGLYGSKHYASEAQAAARTIVGAVNGDMLGYPSTTDSSRLVMTSYQTRSRLLDSAIIYNIRYSLGLNLVDVVDNSAGSDHVPFTNAGYDAIEVAEATASEIWGGSDPYYHKTTDSLNTLNMGMVWNGARLMLTTLTELAQPIGVVGSGSPGFSMSPTSIDFSTVSIGNSKVDSATISNPGTDTLLILSASTDAPEFSMVPISGTIAPGGSAKFYVTFTPATIGSKSGNGIFTHNAAGSPDTVHFIGTCPGNPVISVLPDTIDFGTVEVGNSHSDSIRIMNSGTGTLIIHSITSDDAEYSISVVNDTVLSGGHRWYTIKFEPSEPGSKNGTIIIVHNATGSPDSVYLLGTGTVSTVVITQIVQRGWNLISPPLIADDMSKTTLCPTAVSDAFAYNGLYVVRDTLVLQNGYWVKFASSQSVTITGYEQMSGTVEVNQGWNLIGALSAPIAVSEIISDPPGLITSQFFRYDDAYRPSDTLEPWRGYWVKVNNSGTLSFSATRSLGIVSKNSIKILKTNELPPPPPDGNSLADMAIPNNFKLGQAYPNPFNPVTVIAYELPDQSHVTLRIYNPVGQCVAVLVDEVQGAGHRSVTFDGSLLASGMYFYRLQAGSFIDTKKLLFLK